MTGDLAAAVVQQIADDPAVLGLGDLEVLRVLPSDHAGQASFVLEDHDSRKLYVVDLQLGAADGVQVIRLVERWAALRRQHARRRCFAVLVAEQVEPRHRNILGVIGRTVPVVALEMLEIDGALRFSLIELP